MLVEGHLTRHDTSAVRCDDATDCAVAPSSKLTMMARPSQIAEGKGGGKSVRDIDEEDSQLHRRFQSGTESLCFSSIPTELLLQYPSGTVQLSDSTPKKEIPVNRERLENRSSTDACRFSPKLWIFGEPVRRRIGIETHGCNKEFERRQPPGKLFRRREAQWRFLLSCRSRGSLCALYPRNGKRL